MCELLSQSILKKFEKKITQITTNKNQLIQEQQSKINGYHYDEQSNKNIHGTSIQKFVQLLKKYSKNKIEGGGGGGGHGEEFDGKYNIGNESQRNKQQQRSQNQMQFALQLDNQQQIHQQTQQNNAKIDLQYLNKIVDKQKQKVKQLIMQAPTNSCIQVPSAQQPQLIIPNNSEVHHRNAKNQKNVIAPTVQPQNNAKLYSKDTMPKLSVMNNLLKLSNKLNMVQFLQEVCFKANIMNINPIRLLFFFCVEKMVFIMYCNNGFEKIRNKIGNYQFISKQVCKTLISLLMYLKINQKSLINRIIQAVFTRFGVRQHFSSSFLKKCIRDNRMLFQKTRVDIALILSDTENKKITSGIFKNIPRLEKQVKYQHLKLGLESQQISDELIDDPEKYQDNSKLYYFASQLMRLKEKEDKENGRKLSNESNGKPIKANGYASAYNYNSHTDSEQQVQQTTQKKQNGDLLSLQRNYQPSSFTIQIKKIPLTQNIKILRNQNNKDYEIYKVKKPQIINNESDDDHEFFQIKKKRIITKDDKFKNQKQTNQKKDVVNDCFSDKEKIFQAVEEYLKNNIQGIANRIATVWNINPDHLPKLQNHHLQHNSLPPPYSQLPQQKPYPMFTSQFFLRMEQQNKILKQIIKITQDCELKGASNKQIVKELLKILENKGISNQSKQNILEEWKKFRSRLSGQRK